jgi:hypothetical protein
VWLLIGISCVLGLLVLVPTAIEAAAMRKRCPQCRYDLEGLDRHGVCPECGGVYDKATIAVVGWEFRWRVVPKILLAMLAPAMGPIPFTVTRSCCSATTAGRGKRLFTRPPNAIWSVLRLCCQYRCWSIAGWS